MGRIGILAVGCSFALSSLATASGAQISVAAATGAAWTVQNGCEAPGPTPQRRRGGSLGGLMGSVAGDIVDRQLRDRGLSSGTRRGARDLVENTIACILTASEQAAADAATTRALDRGLGADEGWSSAERSGVSGRSVVTGERVTADGATCRTVTNVAISDGEEVREAQTFCQGEDGRWLRQRA